MRAGIKSTHWNDENGMPTGGTTFGKGFAIGWQAGPLGRGTERQEPNGAFVEDIIAAAADRIAYYQGGKFACEENAAAWLHLQTALELLEERTRRREARQVEGTHQE